MNASPVPSQNVGPSRRPSLIGRILILVNVVLVGVLSLFLIWDYRVEWNTHIREKRVALEEEAKTILPSIQRLRDRDKGSVQKYVDEVCGAMQEGTSPGHHIAVVLGRQTLQARAHHRESARIFSAMKTAVSQPMGIAVMQHESLIAGKAARGDVEVYVSEYLSNIKRIVRAQIYRRTISILVLGLVLGVLLNIVLYRFLTRPIRRIVTILHEFGQGQLRVRMPSFNTRELGLLSDEFNDMAQTLETADSEHRHRMKKARQIQENLLPNLQTLSRIHFTCLFQPAADVAGDYYDVVRLRNDALLLCVADVAGHDVPAAMGAAMLKALLQTAVEYESDPAKVLQILNTAFCRVALEGDFATMILVHLDRSKQTFTFACAGHEPASLIPQKGEIRDLTTTGLPLGVEEKAQWTTTTFNLNPGDRLVMITDGITETLSPTGELFGRERLLAILEETRSKSLPFLREAILQKITAFRGRQTQLDDITLVAVEL